MPASERLLTTSTSLGGIVLFLAQGHTFTVDDVIAAAIFRGDLEHAIEETLALSRAEELAAEHEYEVDGDELQAWSDKFRYEHDLISAGETEEWIEARGMTTDDFTGWMVRQLYLQGLSETRLPTEPENFPELLRVHLWMSGLMDELDTALRRRVAADLELSEREDNPSSDLAMQQFVARHCLDEAKLPSWLAGVGRNEAWLREMVRLEAAFERICGLAVTANARAQQLASMGLSLERIGIETLEFESEAAAREAFLCVRDDGVSLSELARETGFRAEQSEVWLDTFENNLGPRLLCAEEGEALEPVAFEGGFKVFRVVRKFEPSIDDPVVARRLDELIIDQTFTALSSRHIQPPDPARILR